MNTTVVLYSVLAAIVALAIAGFQYFYKSTLKKKSTLFLALLRFLSVFMLLMLFINPKIENTSLTIEKPKLVLAVDNSSSIKYMKGDVEIQNFLKGVKNNKILNSKFDIDYFQFDSDVRELDTLKFNVNSTNISQTLESLNNLYKENTAILFLTDGNQTFGTDYSFFKSKSKLYPIIVGDTTRQEDLKVSKLNVNKYSFLDNNFPVELFINYEGASTVNAVITVQRRGVTVFKKNSTFSQENNSERILFDLPANNVGLHNYTASVSYLENEKNTINNRKNFAVEVIDEQSKIAIISDIKHPDLGMLKRAIETNKQRKVVFLSPGDNLNIKDYTMFVLYQPTVNFKDIFNKIEHKNTFIITGTQTDWPFLNKIQKDFSKEAISSTENYLGVFNANYNVFVVDGIDLNSMSPLQAFYGDIKFSIPNDVLLYQNVNGFDTESPLLASYAINDRKGAVLFGENIWKWRALNYAQSKSFVNFDNFINKIVQYLASTDKFNRIELDYLPVVYQNDLIKITATYFDNNYTIDTRAELQLTVKNKQSNEQTQYPLRLNKNVFESNLSSLKSGDYEFLIKVKGQDISKAGRFTVLDYNIEQQFTYADVDKLEMLASNTDNKAYHITSANEILLKTIEADTSYKSIQKSVKKTVPLVDWRWLLGFIIITFSLEWFIRKYKGLI